MFLLTKTVRNDSRGVYIRTFGYFTVFADGEAVIFKYEKAKELLAVLVDRRGGYVTSSEIIRYLWPEEMVSRVLFSKFRKTLMQLKSTLCEYGIEYIMDTKGNERCILLGTVRCDLFYYMSDPQRYKDLFSGSYMNEYKWGTATLANLLYQSNTDIRKAYNG